MRALWTWTGIVALSLVCAAARAADPPLVDPPAVTSYEIMNGTQPPHVTIPLTIKDGAKVLGARVTRVTVAEKLRPSLIAAFYAYEKEGSVVLSVAFDKVREPTTYGVTLLLEGTGSGATGAVRQPIELQLVFPPAKLRPIAGLVLESERWPWSEPEVTWNLTLRELTKTTMLRNLTVGQVERATQGDKQVDATFAPSTPVSAELPAGRSEDIALEGRKFPLGTTRGQILIEADELEKPIAVPFEVRTKVFDEIILAVFFLSGLLGWYVRHKLKNQEERAELVARLEPLLERAERQNKTFPEKIDGQPPLERANLAKAQQEVKDALEADDGAALTAAVERLRTALQAALDARSALATKKLQTIAALQQALSAKLDLPAELKLDTAPGLLDDAERAVIADDLQKADSLLKTAQDEIDTAGAGIDEWTTLARAALRDFLAIPPGRSGPLLPSAVREEAMTLGAELKKKLEDLPSYNASNRPTSMFDFLRAVDDARRRARRLADLVHIAFATEAEATVAALGEVASVEQDPAIKAGIEAKIAGVRAKTEGLAALENADPKAALPELAHLLLAFSNALNEVLQTKEAKRILEKGDFFAAAAKEATLKKGQDPTEKIASSSARKRTEALRALPPENAVAPVPAAKGVILAARAPVAPVSTAQSRLRKIRIWRGFVSGSILSVIAWVLYRDAWTGTPQDFFGVAAVAFFTDFTIDAVIDAASKLKRPAAGATG